MSCTREQAIKRILERYGKDAVYIFSLGYISRTAYKLCEGKYNAFYMLGSMGLTSAIAHGIMLNSRKRPIVIVRGNGDKVMCPTNWSPHVEYVLDNGIYESTGGQDTPPTMDVIFDEVNTIDIRPSPPDPRITKDPKEIARDIIHCLAS